MLGYYLRTAWKSFRRTPGLRPLLYALRRNPAGAVLIAVQIAITLAVIANVVSIVARRVQRIEQPAGFDTRDTFEMALSSLSKSFDFGSAEAADLAYLRALPGVAVATVTNGQPLARDGADFRFSSQPHDRGRRVLVGVLPADDQALRTLDVPLMAGRNFRPGEIAPFSAADSSPPIGVIILTEHAVRTLFPRGHALGRTVYGYANRPVTVVGVTRNFMGPLVGDSPYDTALIPQMSGAFGQYDLLVRTRPGVLDAVMRHAKVHIGRAHPDAVILYTAKLAHALRRMRANDRNVALFLVAISCAMLATCGFGIIALAAFNVSRRTKQIGVRRALGARKRDVVAHFMTECAVVLAAGTAPGSVLALAVGQWPSAHDGIARLDPWYLLAGIAILALTSQLAVWQPARRAARVPPSLATRTV